MLLFQLFGVATCAVSCSHISSLQEIRDELTNGSHVDGYCTYEEYRCILSKLVELFPRYLGKKTVGRSVEGRALDVYILADKTSTKRKELVFMSALTHGNELQSGVTLINFILDVLEGADNSDPGTLYILQRRNVTWMPVVNPDGLMKELIRKEHPRSPLKLGRKNAHGVDLNRNFGSRYSPENWATLQELRERGKDHLSYPGKYAFSEPETQAIRDVVSWRYSSAVHFHSAGEMLMVPHVSATRAPLHHKWIADVIKVTSNVSVACFSDGRTRAWDECQHFGKLNDNDSISAPGNVNSWMYWRLDILSVGFEVGSDFYVDKSTRIAEAKKWVPVSKYMALKAGCEPRITSVNDTIFQVHNDGASRCPALFIAYKPTTGRVTHLPNIRRGMKAGGYATVSMPQNLDKNTLLSAQTCIKEPDMDSCICNAVAPNKGVWVNREHEVCRLLVDEMCSSGDTLIFRRPTFSGRHIDLHDIDDPPFFSRVDVYCTFSVRGVERGRTSRIDDNSLPQWPASEVTVLGIENIFDDVLIECWDHDVGYDPLIGDHHVEVALLRRDERTRERCTNFGQAYIHRGTVFSIDVTCSKAYHKRTMV